LREGGDRFIEKKIDSRSSFFPPFFPFCLPSLTAPGRRESPFWKWITPTMEVRVRVAGSKRELSLFFFFPLFSPLPLSLLPLFFAFSVPFQRCWKKKKARRPGRVKGRRQSRMETLLFFFFSFSSSSPPPPSISFSPPAETRRSVVFCPYGREGMMSQRAE